MPGERATVVDLFSGAGGFSLGLHAAGARIVAAVDASEAASSSFRHNFRTLQPGEEPVVLGGDEGRIEHLDLASLGLAPDLVIGGPPCQGFSRIGRAKLASLAEDPEVLDPRNELYQRFVHAIRLWRPRAFIMENVPGMLSLRGVNVADTIGADLAACGYRVGYALLNSAWYGVAQFRERLFFVGIRHDLGARPSVPAVSHRVDLPSGYARPLSVVTLPLSFIQHFELDVPVVAAGREPATVGNAIEDLPAIVDHLAPGAAALRGDFRRPVRRTMEPGAPLGRLLRRWPSLPELDVIDDHVVRRTPRDYETFARMRPDDRYPEALAIAESRLEEALEALRRDGKSPAEGTPAYEELRRGIVPPYPVSKFVDKWRKLDRLRPSWTVTAHLSKDAYSHIHYDPAQARAISVREAARLQSFPDGFRFLGNMGDCFAQIGNAVPPLLAWALGAHVLSLAGMESVAPP